MRGALNEYEALEAALEEVDRLEEKLRLARELVARALEASTEELEAALEGAALLYAEGLRDGIRLALEKVREVLEP